MSWWAKEGLPAAWAERELAAWHESHQLRYKDELLYTLPASEDDIRAMRAMDEGNVPNVQDRTERKETDMGLILKNEGGGAPIEPGAWAAVCSGYIQLGTHTSSFGGEEARRAPRLMVTWWMPDQRREINRRYGLTMHQKGSLRPAIESMVGKLTPEMEAEFDLDHILGRPCLLEVKQKAKPDGKVFAEIASVGSLPRGMPRPAPVETRTYIMHDAAGNFVMPPEWIAPWIRNIIAESEEYIAATTTQPKEETTQPKEEVPF